MVKDINAPKRPLVGYMRFISTIREEVERETGLNGIKVTPHLSARWNALSEEEKETFNKVFRVTKLIAFVQNFNLHTNFKFLLPLTATCPHGKKVRFFLEIAGRRKIKSFFYLIKCTRLFKVFLNL